MVKRTSSKQNDSPGQSLVQIDLAAGAQANTGNDAQETDKKRSRRETKPQSLVTIPKKKARFAQPETLPVYHVRM